MCAAVLLLQDHSADAKIGNIAYSLLDSWSTLDRDEQQAKLTAIHEYSQGGTAPSSSLDAPQLQQSVEAEGDSLPQETAEMEASDDQGQD